MTLLLSSTAERAKVWAEVFAEAGQPIFVDAASVQTPADVTVLACWQTPKDLSIYPNLRAVLSVGAGVDQIPDLPPHLVLCRSLAPGIEAQVRDWVTMACLMLHRDMPAYLAQAKEGAWINRPVAQAPKRRIGILGMGRIGKLLAGSLTALGFPVVGWSRSGTAVEGIRTYGAADFETVLAQSDILVCLLPLTQETRGVLGEQTFALLPKGAHLVHAGRGAQLDMPALRAALDSGQLSTAMLDVTNPEPLPQDHWAWADPRVVVTPHVAAQTDAGEGARHALDVVSAIQRGETPPGMINLQSGY